MVAVIARAKTNRSGFLEVGSVLTLRERSEVQQRLLGALPPLSFGTLSPTSLAFFVFRNAPTSDP